MEMNPEKLDATATAARFNDMIPPKMTVAASTP
jgi:hypothetical protein